MPKCDPSRIRQFLQHELSTAEQLELEQHLESCDACCHHLHDSTADAVWWDEMSLGDPFMINELHHPVTGVSLDLAFVIVPEPATMAILCLGAVGALARRRGR